MATVEELQQDVTRLTDLVNTLNGINSTLYEQFKYRGDLLEEANNHRGILQTALAQRDAEIAELRRQLDELTHTSPEPAPTPPPSPPPGPDEPSQPTDPTEPPSDQPETPTDPTVPLPPNPTPTPPVVQDLTLVALYESIGFTLPLVRPNGLVASVTEYRKEGGAWAVLTTESGDPYPLWSQGPVLKGSLLHLESDTAYEVRVTVDGVAHGGSVRTLRDVQASHAELVGAA